jgi:hypothetical protein
MDEDPDRALSPALVRKGAKRFLLAQGHDAHDEDENEVEFEADYLPNLGLELRADGARIRVLRSDHGQMPVPGTSQRRQSFYAQQGEFEWDDDEEEIVAPVINYVLHWSTDDEYNLEKVYLGCPKAGDTTRASVESYWDEPIWRRHSPLTADGTQVEAEVTELDIYLDSENTGTA